MYIIVLDPWGNQVDYRNIESEEDEVVAIVKDFAKANNFTTKFCITKPELLSSNQQLNKYEEDMKKISMKKVEASKADKAMDKKMGTKEGSAKDKAQDKKLMIKMKKK